MKKLFLVFLVREFEDSANVLFDFKDIQVRESLKHGLGVSLVSIKQRVRDEGWWVFYGDGRVRIG